MKELFEVWKKSTGFDKNGMKQKASLVCFGVFGTLTVAFCWSMLVIPFGLAAVASLMWCLRNNCYVEE